MNFLKRWILIKIGNICPHCYGKLSYRLPCSNGFGLVCCENYDKNECDYGYSYKIGS